MESLPSERITYTLSQISDLANIGKTKLYEEINAGRLKIHKYGNRTLVLRDDLLVFLAEVIKPVAIPDYANN
jgi:excisionase family DNA binding protein